MVCVMMHRSEMQVLSAKFWRCSPISLFAQGARSLRFGCLSRTNERADRGRTHQRTRCSALRPVLRVLRDRVLCACRARARPPGRFALESRCASTMSASTIQPTIARDDDSCASTHLRLGSGVGTSRASRESTDVKCTRTS